MLDPLLPFCKHGKGWGLYPAHNQSFKISRGVCSGSIHSNQPVSLCPAHRSHTEILIFFLTFHCLKTFLNGGIFHRADPQTFHWFPASGKHIHPLKDQFSFSSCITAIDQILHITSIHQSFYDFKLLLFILGNFQLPCFWKDWQIIKLPFFIFRVIFLWLCVFCQMS